MDNQEAVMMNAAQGAAVAAFASMLAIPGSNFSAAAQSNTEVAIDRYSCRELLRESGTDRDVAVAFIHGYILGKSGATKLDVQKLRKETNVFIERCLDSPQAGALDTALKSGMGSSDR
jgi:hypothetical protein